MLIRSTTRNAVHRHEVVIEVVDAPVLKSHNFYYPEETYVPEKLTLEWLEGQQPGNIELFGTADRGNYIKRSFGLRQAPEWLRQAVQESISEAADWDWGN